MLAAVYHGIQDIRVEEVEGPPIGPEEALLRVRAATICGTDLRIYTSGHFKIPPGTKRILGHEVAGEVAAVGQAVKALKPGQRIAIAPNIGCGTCWQCIQGHNHMCPDYEAFGISLDGAFAQYMRIPAPFIQRGNIAFIPESLSYEEAALNEPFSCCYNGSRACRIEPGDMVLIIGAGPIGIMHLFLARLSGASLVIVSEMIEERLAQAMEFGADLVVNPARDDVAEVVQKASGGRGADVVIVAAPSPAAQEQALELVATQGRINFFGGLPTGKEFIRFNSNLVHYKGIIVTGTTGSSSFQFRRSMEILASGRVKLARLISARFPLTQIKEAFDLAASKKILKVVVEP
ncbi:MAG: zinc-dependent dehydrogenase [Anaerolineae bacterium]